MTFWVTGGCFVRKSQELCGCDRGDGKAESELAEQKGLISLQWTFTCWALSVRLQKRQWTLPGLHMPINKTGNTESNIDNERASVGVH